MEETLPCTKKLQCTEPDLKVTLLLGENSQPNEKVYEMYLPVIAGLSNFIDTAVSGDSTETHEVVLANVAPELFEKALSFLQNPVAARNMTVEDALEVVPFYHRYEFSGGLDLCDDIFCQEIQQHKAKDLDLLVKVTATANKNNLSKSERAGCETLNSKILAKAKESPILAAALTISHVEALQGMFKDGLLILPEGFSQEEVDNPLFPKYFHKCMSLRFFESKTRNEGSLKLHGMTDAPHEFKLSGTSGWWMSGTDLAIGRGSSSNCDWVIQKKIEVSDNSVLGVHLSK